MSCIKTNNNFVRHTAKSIKLKRKNGFTTNYSNRIIIFKWANVAAHPRSVICGYTNFVFSFLPLCNGNHSWRTYEIDINVIWEIEMAFKVFPKCVLLVNCTIQRTQSGHNLIWWSFFVHMCVALHFEFTIFFCRNAKYMHRHIQICIRTRNHCTLFIAAVAERHILSLRQTEKAFIFLDDIRNEASRSLQQQTKRREQEEKWH